MYKTEKCRKAEMAIRDTLDVVGGKWKLILISILREGPLRFNQLGSEAGISPRILSKELTELQMNGLVERIVTDTKPVTVRYGLTPYCETLKDVLEALEKWGVSHRQHIVNNEI